MQGIPHSPFLSSAAAGAWGMGHGCDYHESSHARLLYVHSSTDDAAIQEELRRRAI
jgi:hypothetical protein